MTDSPSEPTPVNTTSSPAPTITPSQAPARKVWPWVLLLLAIVAGGLWFWDAQKRLAVAERSSSEWRQIADELRGRQLDVDRELDTLRDRQRAIDSRLTDIATGQRVMREEVLGISERAGLLEDALNRLAASRQEGALAMLLDEAEFLLLTGEERLSLFRDVRAAIRAFQLADAALAGLPDPVYAPLRQSLAQEIAGLQAMPADMAPQIRQSVRALLADLSTLPGPAAQELRHSAGESRLMSMLSSLITVRRLDDAGVPLDPLVRSAKIQALALQLETALSALERGGELAWSSGGYRETIKHEMAALFDQNDSRVASHMRAIEELSLAPPPPPPTIGNTLAELRNLRAAYRDKPATVSAVVVPAVVTEASASATPDESTEVEQVEEVE